MRFVALNVAFNGDEARSVGSWLVELIAELNKLSVVGGCLYAQECR